MKILFLVRNDFFSKFGGDTFQVQQYISASPPHLNVQVQTLSDFSFFDNYDRYVLVNTDRAYEFIEFSLRISREKLHGKVVVLPIHHSMAAV